ncbi:ribosome maturation factor RimM [Buchnera aphidicola]|uniref:ribosome maturation factor RimM n=1 Tax=Buchnera aphidicola TaxID=9 RepID=UPI001E3F583A|nr:ribosome maturation factor RimM [Buchnera aphidicola]
MRVFSFTENKKNIFKYFPWYIQNKKKITHVQSWKDRNKYFVIKIENIQTRCMANTLKNCHIYINSNILPKLQNEDYYWKDIISCSIYNIQNQKLGIVTNLIKTPAHDVLVISNKSKNNIKVNKNILIPFIEKKIIKKVSIIEKTIIVDWNYNFE